MVARLAAAAAAAAAARRSKLCSLRQESTKDSLESDQVGLEMEVALAVRRVGPAQRCARKWLRQQAAPHCQHEEPQLESPTISSSRKRRSCHGLGPPVRSLQMSSSLCCLLILVTIYNQRVVGQLSGDAPAPAPTNPDEATRSLTLPDEESPAGEYRFHESSFVRGPAPPAAPAEPLASAASSVGPARQTQATSGPEAGADPQADSLDWQQQQAYDYHANMPVITKRELANAIKLATGNVERQHAWLMGPSEAGAEQAASLNLLETGSAGWLASSMFHKPTPSDAFLLNQTKQALISEESTRLLAKQYKLNKEQVMRGLPLISVEQTTLGRECARPARTFSCMPGRYRSLSGHCNNVQQPDWGAAQTPLVRYAPARYADHIALPLPSEATSGGAQAALPSARRVSAAIHEAAAQVGEQTHSHMTTMLSFFGQFIFHDLAFVPQFSKSLKCCGSSASSRHPECMPIELKGTTKAAAGAAPAANFCLDYVRSTPAARHGCNLGPREQLNLVSAFLDGSAIYGSTEAQMRQLRTFSGGRLRSQRLAASSGAGAAGGSSSKQQLELLPQIGGPPDVASNNHSLGQLASDPLWLAAARDCQQMAKMRRLTRDAGSRAPREAEQASAANCFQAGDSRVNENIGLTLMHTIWMREHNLLADRLAQLNRHWRDERLFQEARRIVVAELQQIAYSEFLPSILGDEVMARFNLTVSTQGYSQLYEPEANPGIANELATAVFPFILSTIPSALERYSERLEMLGSTRLADTFMDGSDLFKRNMFAQYLTGMMSQSAMEPALGLVPMTMAMGSGNEGLAPAPTAPATNSTALPQVDAVALALQQGRDHGLRPYLYWRRVCQLRPVVRSWRDLEQVMPAATVRRLQQAYSSPEQLELYLALLEHPAPGATVGPTFVCLLARQFYQLKRADRYWFENDLPGSAFTPAQLDQIRQSSLAKVVCRNSQASISFIQPSAMLASDPFLNAYQYCSNRALTELELAAWREPVNSAQQLQNEQLMGELDALGSARALSRAKRLIEDHRELIGSSLERAKRQLDHVAHLERARIRSAMGARVRARRQAAGGKARPQPRPHAAGYRYLPRLKRQALNMHNQSVIFELATNEVVRSLLRRGRDREQPQSVQDDIRDFLYSLETIQLDNLLENSAASEQVSEFIAAANGAFLSQEQRQRLAAAGPASLAGDPLDEILAAAAGGGAASAGARSSSVSPSCQEEERVFPCDHTSPYRTITGWCNNLQSPKFGQSFTLHDRILPSAYEDGLGRPRQLSVTLAAGDGASTGQRLPLPSARRISTAIHEDRSKLHARYSLALMQFGQFGVDHDLTRTPFAVALDGTLLDCSDCDSQRALHRECQPIEIPDDDPFFQSAEARERLGAGKRCLHFVRSLNGQAGLGPRQQLNALTAYLDGSEIYGSDICEANSLRSFAGGRLNSSSGQQLLGFQARELLPTTRANPECATPSGLCFHAGDQRASEQPGLTAMHIVWMRFHNSIVDQLGQLNRHWSDERLYQEGRRIVGAVLQRITYAEFAPRILGLDYMSKFDLLLKQAGYSHHYDHSCSASILTEFASAAFRMGHSLIRSAFPLLNTQYKPAGKAFQLRAGFFNSQRILSEPLLVDSILRGLVSTPVETLDSAVTEELTNHLFERPKAPFSGMDLVALNIQRARDHGVPAYNRYRLKCNLTRARTFDELAPEIPAKLIKRLASVYASVHDIDLFTGGMSELPVHGGIIGPTLACIIGLQLQRLKRCDRFWHETGDPYVRFSAAQLAELRKMTLSKVICSQSDSIQTIQRQAMDVPDSYLNPRVACSSLAGLDLSVWRENQRSACVVNKIKIELAHSKRVSPCKSCTCTLEGPVCRTAKINCLKMVQKVANELSAIMADKSCLVQCAWALEVQAA